MVCSLLPEKSIAAVQSNLVGSFYAKLDVEIIAFFREAAQVKFEKKVGYISLTFNRVYFIVRFFHHKLVVPSVVFE